MDAEPIYWVRLPQSDFAIHLGAHQIKVRWEDGDSEALKPDEDQGFVMGEWDMEAMTIHLRKGLKDSLALSAFIHEVCHALEDLWEVEASHKDINLLGEGLAQCLMSIPFGIRTDVVR